MAKAVQRPRWIPDLEAMSCKNCNKGFSLFVRRHHCRNCGEIFCDPCASTRASLGKYGYGERVRVCKPCYERLEVGRVEHPQRKICILGFSCVGKTAITSVYVKGSFPIQYRPTIDQSYSKLVNLRSTDYAVTIVDTAAQDELSPFQPSYSIGTHGFILLYDVNDFHSFDILKCLYDKLITFCPTDVAIILVGNKCDLTSQRQVTYETGANLAAQWGIDFVECSAKTNENVNRVFELVMNKILDIDGVPLPAEPKPGCVVM